MTTALLDKRVNDFVSTERRLYIDGNFVDAAATARHSRHPIRQPGRLWHAVAEGDAEDIDRAVRPSKAEPSRTRCLEDHDGVRARADRVAHRRPDR